MPKTSPLISVEIDKQPPLSVRSDISHLKGTVFAGAIGTVIEFFDFGIYSFLAVILASNFFPKGDPTAALLATFAVFGVAYVIRPLGGIVLGHIGDHRGRRFVLALSVTLMALSTAMIGILPSYEKIGIWAPALLVLLRCIQGASAGGEVGAAITYIAEVSPDSKRGQLTSAPQLGTIAGTMLASFTVLLVSISVSHDQMMEWGWRIPFLLSFPLGMFGLLVRFRLQESEIFVKSQAAGKVAKIPVFTAITKYPKVLFTIFCMSLVSFSSYYIVFTFLSTSFQRQGLMSISMATWTTTLAALTTAISIPFWGRLSDRVGRKPVLLTACVANLVLVYPAFLVMGHSALAAAIAQIFLGQLSAAYFSVNLTVYCELFPNQIRLSALSLGHNLAALIAAGMAPYIATYLIAKSGSAAAPSWFVMATAVISLCAILTIKETAGKPLPS